MLNKNKKVHNKSKNSYKLNDFYNPDRKIKVQKQHTRLIGIFLAFLLFFNFVAPFIPFFQSFFGSVLKNVKILPDNNVVENTNRQRRISHS